MAVIGQSKIIELSQAADPKKALIAAVGDISDVRICGANVFIGIYIRPEKTAGGIIRPHDNIKEDAYQGNVGLILKLGDEFSDEDQERSLHHWVMFGYNDGLRLRYNGVDCKVLPIDRVRAFDIDPTKVL